MGRPAGRNDLEEIAVQFQRVGHLCVAGAPDVGRDDACRHDDASQHALRQAIQIEHLRCQDHILLRERAIGQRQPQRLQRRTLHTCDEDPLALPPVGMALEQSLAGGVEGDGRLGRQS